MPKLYKCATTYTKLRKDVVFELELGHSKGIEKVVLSFPRENFRHFIGAVKEKITDLPQYTERISPTQFYQKVCNRTITEFDIRQSADFSNPLSETIRNGIEYFLEDRWDTIANLYDYLHNSNSTNIDVYKWERDVYKDNRPNRSEICADLMISFSCTQNKKDPDEKALIFMIKEGSNNLDNFFAPVSGFPSNLDYTRCEHNNDKPLERYVILTLSELDRATGIKVDLIKAAPDEIAKYQKIEANKPDPKTKEMFVSVDKQAEKLRISRKEYVNSHNSETEKNYNKAKKELEELVETKTPNWLFALYDKLYAALEGAKKEGKTERKELLEEEIAIIKKGLSERNININQMTINQVSVDNTGAIVVASVIAIPLSEWLNNFKNNLQQAIHTVMDEVKLTFQSLGTDGKKLLSNAKSFVEKNINPNNDAAKKPKRKSETINSDNNRSTVNVPPAASRYAKIDRSNLPNLQKGILDPKKKIVAENEKNRTDRPQQHNRNKGDDAL
ncbi:MAG: hypothetical protein IJ716_01420 [Lachnospiraceae bacterium]|nr:hypothetical protein [Lachnospiraceae bacterium]